MRWHLRAGEEEPVTLPCGVSVVLRVQGPLDVPRACRLATEETGIDTSYGLAVSRQLQAQASKAAEAREDVRAAQGRYAQAVAVLAKAPADEAAQGAMDGALDEIREAVAMEAARLRSRLIKTDPEAHAALADIDAWNLAALYWIAAVGLVECAELADAGASTWRPATPAEAVARLRGIQPEAHQALVVGEIRGALAALSELGTLGKAPSGPPSGSTTASAGTPGGPAAPTAGASA